MSHEKMEKKIKVNAPVTMGKEYELKIERMGSNAEGVSHVDGFAVFVKGALAGEVVVGKVTLVKKNYAVADVKKWLRKSADRVEPKCDIYYECGGCQMQHISYEAQLRIKRQQVIDAIEHIGKQKNVDVLATIGAKNPWNYRNKMMFPVGSDNGSIQIGCFAQGTHRIIDTKCCYIQNEINNDIANAVREALTRYKVPVYDEDRHTGILRHVIGRVGRGGKAMVVFVTARDDFPKAKEIGLFLRKRIPSLISIQQNIQTYRNIVIMGRDTKVLWGKATIDDSIGELKFHISPRSFFQVNTAQAEVLYSKALEYANLSGEETVIDAYCGTGTITLFLARRARKAYGIEIVAPAIQDAKKNARDNHVRNAEFIVGDATAVMPRLYKEGVRADVIVVDPPRAGCSEKVLKTIASMKPKRVVYVSCNPATLARDLSILEVLGYKAQKVQPVDMFPMTSHVETVVLLSRVK